MAELPFMATENIMMDAVEKGGNRQELHERIREYSMIAGARVKKDGLDNNLCELILNDPMFMITKEEMRKLRSQYYSLLLKKYCLKNGIKKELYKDDKIELKEKKRKVL